MRKKILTVLLTLVCVMSLPVTAFGAEYGNEYPTYVKYSGGAYIEVQSAIGRGTIVLQNSYKNGFIGFTGDKYYLCNLSNSTITGRFILSNGTEYNCRFSAFEAPQYYYQSGTSNQWRYLNTTQIYNTNCEFIDNTSLERNNKIDLFDTDEYKYSVVALLCVQLGVFILILIKIARG